MTQGLSYPGWWGLRSPGARCRRLIRLFTESVRGRTLPSRPFPFRAMSQTGAAQWPPVRQSLGSVKPSAQPLASSEGQTV